MPSQPLEIRTKLMASTDIFEESHRYALSRILKQAIVDYFRQENLELETIEYVYYLDLVPKGKKEIEGKVGNVDDILGD